MTAGHNKAVPLTVRPAKAREADFLTQMLVAAVFWRTERPSGTVVEVLSQPEAAHHVAGWLRPGDLGVIARDGKQPVGAA